MNLFDAAEARSLRDTGMAAAASYPCDEPVKRARNIAIMLAKREGYVTADMVQGYLAERLPEVFTAIQPNAWGAVFQSPKLKFNGKVVASNRVARHAGIQRCWEYVI